MKCDVSKSFLGIVQGIGPYEAVLFLKLPKFADSGARTTLSQGYVKFGMEELTSQKQNN